MHESFKSVLPSPIPCALLGGLFLAAGIGASIWLFDDLSLLIVIPALTVNVLVVTVFFCAAAFPQWFMYGVRPFESGFEFRAPARRPIHIRYEKIYEIVVSVKADGFGQFELLLLVHSDDGEAWLTPELVSQSGFNEKMATLPNFDQKAYDESGLAGLPGAGRNSVERYTVVYRRAEILSVGALDSVVLG